MRRAGERIACVTFTNRAVAVIGDRLGSDDLFHGSTLHGFLWGEIKSFQRDIQSTVVSELIPRRIAKKKEDDKGASQKARAARRRISEFENDILYLSEKVQTFTYEETGGGSRYSKGRLDHDDVVDLFGIMVQLHPALRRVVGQRYPYIFVDEAQDTFPNIVEAFNSLSGAWELPVVGYFGDPMQQIYEKRAGDFRGPINSAVITKPENYRCSTEVINLLNAFRKDIQQKPGPKNVAGSVEIRLIQGYPGQGIRKTYTDEQVSAAVTEFDKALAYFGWADDETVKRMFLVRQMIARRLGFAKLNTLFTGKYSSQSSESDYEDGKHYLLQPFLQVLWPIVEAAARGDKTAVFHILRTASPLLDPKGDNGRRSVKDLSGEVDSAVLAICDGWTQTSLGDLLRIARKKKLIPVSDRLAEQLDRNPRPEPYDEELHALDKGDWLADEFFKMSSEEIAAYLSFVMKQTALSTQHGVKGEEYGKVLVIFDDTEANWTNYNFSRLLTPKTAEGELTEGQRLRGAKLAYVCFSRAERDLRIILFTPNPSTAKDELVQSGLFREDQVSIQG
jgi:DNA helicase-2/ATP-dependent DNA helicase PcrA